jgi:hypothetical protein
VTAGIVGLVASYVVLAALLLSLNLRSAWRWQVKAAAICVSAGFFVITFVAVQAMMGWPTGAVLPARFQLHAALIDEPDRRGRGAGAIYLWLSPRDQDGEIAGPPRAYALPYSRALHEAAVRAQADLQAGRAIDGIANRAGRPTGLATPAVPVDLFEPVAPPLPPKTG